MGTCWSCVTELSLQDGQTTCDNCGEIVYYKCNNCKEEFKVEDKESKKRLKECKLCEKCPPHKKSGKLYELKERSSNKDVCQCYRGQFLTAIKLKEDENEGFT